MVPAELDGGNVTQDTARIAPVGAESHFVLRYLQGPAAQGFFTAVARGVAVKGVNIRDLRTLPVPVPPPEVQRKIIDYLDDQLSHVDDLVGYADSTETHLNNLRRSILHAAFSGTLTAEWRATHG